MNWRNTLVGNDTPVFHNTTAGVDSARVEVGHTLWCVDKKKSHTLRVNINDDGQVEGVESAFDHLCDTLLFYNDGYITVQSRDNPAVLSGFTKNHQKVWEHPINDGETFKWKLAPCEDGSLYLFYSIKGPCRSAHVLCLDGHASDRFHHVFTVPDIDLLDSQIIVSMKDRLAVCSRNHGSQVVSYCLDKRGKILSRSAFSDHHLSKGAVPLCATPADNGTYLLGGYREEVRAKQRVPWLCLFDSDMMPLHDTRLPGGKLEQAIKMLAVQEDGSILALSSPWIIYRISPKGFLTHSWQMPPEMHCKVITSIKPVAGMDCMVTGTSYTEEDGSLVPTVWIDKIHENDFEPVTGI